MMSIDNRVAKRKPDSHSIGFGCIESLKEFCGGFRPETNSRIYYTKPHPITFIPFCFDEQLPRAIAYCAHGVRSISQQVQDNLLQLDTVADDGRQVLGELRPQDYPIPLKV